MGQYYEYENGQAVLACGDAKILAFPSYHEESINYIAESPYRISIFLKPNLEFDSITVVGLRFIDLEEGTHSFEHRVNRRVKPYVSLDDKYACHFQFEEVKMQYVSYNVEVDFEIHHGDKVETHLATIPLKTRFRRNMGNYIWDMILSA